jgi:glycosyltransferase involved in cell wall biosynthesis
MCKFSVITINFNNAQGLVRTIESIVNQTFHDFEFIVIDGGSKDESTTIIQNFSAKIRSKISWVSEKDNGIYHAMNKGIKKSTGDFLIFINSGDILANNTVLESANSLMNLDADLCSGILIIDDGHKKQLIHPIQELSLSYSIHGGLTHPNTFIKRRMFSLYGLYNENNKIVSDWEFFLIVGGLHNIKYQAINIPIACFYLDGISSSPTQAVLISEETNRAIQKNIPTPILIDMKRLKSMESKMKESHFYAFNYLMETYPKAAKVIFSPLKVVNFFLKRIKKVRG